MTSSISGSASLCDNHQPVEDVSKKSLFSVFRPNIQIFDTLKLEALEQLLKQGADVNEVNMYGMNFLQTLIEEEFFF